MNNTILGGIAVGLFLVVLFGVAVFLISEPCGNELMIAGILGSLSLIISVGLVDKPRHRDYEKE